MTMKRQANFKQDEVSALLEGVEKRRAVIFGENGNEVTSVAKKGHGKISPRRSVCGGVHCDVLAIKKKWSDMKSLAKRRQLKTKDG